MRKWAFWFAAAAIVVIGCGGSSGGGSSAGSSSGSTSGSFRSATVNLESRDATSGAIGSPYGSVVVGYLTGQGRAVDDLYMNIQAVELADEISEVSRVDSTALSLKLAGFQYQSLDLNVPFFNQAANANSRLFPSFTLRPFTFATELGSGAVNTKPGQSGVITSMVNLPKSFASYVRTYPGRTTFLPVFVDDSMFVNSGTDVTFVDSQFTAINQPATDDATTSGKMLSHLSDYVRFSLAGLPDSKKPELSTSTESARVYAGYVYFTGDNYALSSADPRGTFEVLTESDSVISGSLGPPFGEFPGTYDLKQANPTDLSGVAKITSLYGYWRDYTKVLANIGSTEFIILPNSFDEFNETHPADIVAIVRTGSVITDMYFGQADLTKGEFSIYPIKNITDGSTAGEIKGFLTDYTNRSGGSTTDEPSVRNGRFTFDGTAPTGFATTGRFVVFRR